MLNYRRQIASDPDDPQLLLDNRLKQFKLFVLDTTYVALVWALLIAGVGLSVLPVFLADEYQRPVLIRGLQLNARLFIGAIVVVVGGKLVQETLVAFLVKGGHRSDFSVAQQEVLRRIANRLIRRR